MIKRIGLFTVAVTSLAAASVAQVPEDVQPYLAFGDTPDRFFEYTDVDAAGAETEGWLFSHWTGQWRASGEATVTDLQIVIVRHDPEINTPPVLLGVTVEASPHGVATRQIRRMSLEGGTETQDRPADAWIIPSPLELGRTWSSGSHDQFRWSRIEDLNGPNPNPLFETEGCLIKMTVAAERLASGDLAVEVEMSHWARGHGVVWIDQWRGALEGIDGEATIDEQAEQVIDRIAELPETVTIQAIPQEETE